MKIVDLGIVSGKLISLVIFPLGSSTFLSIQISFRLADGRDPMYFSTIGITVSLPIFPTIKKVNSSAPLKRSVYIFLISSSVILLIVSLFNKGVLGLYPVVINEILSLFILLGSFSILPSIPANRPMIALCATLSNLG